MQNARVQRVKNPDGSVTEFKVRTTRPKLKGEPVSTGAADASGAGAGDQSGAGAVDPKGKGKAVGK